MLLPRAPGEGGKFTPPPIPPMPVPWSPTVRPPGVLFRAAWRIASATGDPGIGTWLRPGATPVGAGATFSKMLFGFSSAWICGGGGGASVCGRSILGGGAVFASSLGGSGRGAGCAAFCAGIGGITGAGRGAAGRVVDGGPCGS